MTIDIDPVVAHLGPFALSWYGVVVAIAIVVGVWLAAREARRKGLPVAEVESLALWVVAGLAVFLVELRTPLMLLGISTNLVGIAVMLRQLRRIRGGYRLVSRRGALPV